MKKHKAPHTGPLHHKGMTSHMVGGLGGKDPHASAEHHAANRAHGMAEGMSPKGGYDGEEMEQGGEGMGENCESY